MLAQIALWLLLLVLIYGGLGLPLLLLRVIWKSPATFYENIVMTAVVLIFGMGLLTGAYFFIEMI